MSVPQERLYSVEEFERFLAQPENRDRLFELINGEIIEKSLTEEHGVVTATVATAIRNFVVQYRLGRVGVEICHQLPHDTRYSMMPDVSFIAGKRPAVTVGAVPRMPDFAVEVKSRDDSLKDVRDKAHYYLLNGSKLVWIVNPAKQLVIVLTPDDEDILLENETLDGGDVLPGFKLAVRDIFADLD